MPTPPGRHRHLLFRGRKSFHQDSLRGWNHRGAGQTLEQAKEDDFAQRPRGSAQSRRDHEGTDGREKITFTPEPR